MRILKKEKKRADDAVSQLTYITSVKPLSSLSSSSTSTVSQPKEVNMDTFVRNHEGKGFTMLQLGEENVEMSIGHGERMLTMPQFREGKADIFPTDRARQPSTGLQFKAGNGKTFLVDTSGELPMVLHVGEKNVHTFPMNRREEVFTEPRFREGNLNSFGVNHEGQASTAVKSKGENMDTLLAEDKRVSTEPQFREGNMEIQPEGQGQALQYMKRGIYTFLFLVFIFKFLVTTYSWFCSFVTGQFLS